MAALSCDPPASVAHIMASSPPLRRPHPCLDEAAHGCIARVHLPVAPRCNTHCGYCERGLSADQAPGATTAVLRPTEAAARAAAFLDRSGPLGVVGVAGPGEPLANPETLETLRLVRAG